MLRKRLIAILPALVCLGFSVGAASGATIGRIHAEFDDIHGQTGKPWVLTGHVSIALTNASLKADQVRYDESRREITAQGKCVLTSAGTSVHSETLRMELVKDSTGKMALRSGTASGGVTINSKQAGRTGSFDAVAETAVLDQASGLMTLTGSARVVTSDPEASLSAESIRCTLPRASGGAVACEAAGGVRIHAKSVTPGKPAALVDATSQRASLSQESGQNVVTLTGGVDLKVTDQANPSEPDTLTGDTAVYNLGTGEMHVTRGSSAQVEVTIKPKEKPKSQPSQR